MRPAHALSAFCLLLAAGPLGGCSLISTTRLDDDHPISQDVDCSGWLPPTLDLGLGLALSVGAGLAFADVYGLDETWNLAGGVAGSLLGAFFLATAVTGYVWTADCRSAEELHLQWRLEDDDARRRALEEQWRHGRGLPEEGRTAHPSALPQD